jgi:menaquinone-9 beta-reductase
VKQPSVRDVLIIGAGPAGSAAAIHLARLGHDVLLVDRCRFPRPKPCGEYYNPECWRLLRELRVLPAVEAAGAQRIEAVTAGVSGGSQFLVRFRQVTPNGDAAFSLPREQLDALLAAEARTAGAECWEGTLCRAPWVEDGIVVGAELERNRESVNVRARLVLAADGLHSRFARRLGLGAPVALSARSRLGLSARIPTAAGAPPVIAMRSRSEDGCCGLVIRHGEANVGLAVAGGRSREIGGDPTAFLRRELERYPDLLAYCAGPPESVRTTGPLPWSTHTQYVPGCLLIGDAAGFYDPFTGQGVTFALMTAALAAEVAHEALRRGDGSRRVLRQYGHRRRRLLAPRVAVQRAIREVLARPRMLEHVLRRLERRADAAETLIGIISDIRSPYSGASPRFLARLLL